MFRYLLPCIILLSSSNCYAQFVSGSVSSTGATPGVSMPTGSGFSTTIQEGMLRGSADVIRSEGMYLQGLGTYEVLHQDAYSKALDNNFKRINYRIEIRRRLAQERANRPKKPIHVREYNPDWYFTVDGKQFSSIEEWRDSPEYFRMRLRQEETEYVEKKVGEFLTKRNLKQLKNWNKNRNIYSLNHD